LHWGWIIERNRADTGKADVFGCRDVGRVSSGNTSPEIFDVPTSAPTPLNPTRRTLLSCIFCMADREYCVSLGRKREKPLRTSLSEDI